jgi:predicted dehydrogenase
MSLDTVEKPLGIGIVGCGYWGVNYVRVFTELTGAHVVGVCDSRPERVPELQRRFPGVFATTQLTELLSQDKLDAVVVCTEATQHYGVALRCLKAGKHVLVEKPLTTDLSDAEKLTLLAERSGLTLMVGHTFMYNAAIRNVKEYLTKSPCEVYYVYSRRTNLGPIRRDVNALWDLATHDIVIFNYLLDSVPEWVSAVAGKVLRNCREDIGFISLGYPGGILGHIHVSWADAGKAREVVVVCGDKRIVFDDLNGLEQVRVFEKGIRPVTDEPVGYGEYRLQIRDGDIVSPKIEVSEPLKNQCRHFLDCIGSGQQPISNGRSGIEVLRVLNAVDRSVATQGGRVEVEKDAGYSEVGTAIAAR